MVQAVIPHIRPGGRIINITSITQKVGMIAVPMYNATKAALDSLAFTWAGEVSRNPLLAAIPLSICLIVSLLTPRLV